ncbi:prokaryotic ubiquitin-like protein Pup [Zafaria cholistanensis]|uniref:Prokaryotic ubiquitin-like protein Pup n=1 Tax=Zafaria cholistanensis TaxID=1682741 RepID=A0A5A7NNB4_9MICC|nr:ubiquitin-like protein Pup [Zafaria cholistanensis]GER22089.1 prokaryotic ubiquitin-like protein Pup [Zafaria cholistanensis]
MAQEQFKAQPAQGAQEEETEAAVSAGPSAAAQEQVQAVDDLLDEIDGVLERNAEEFVRGFVQKGGQ